MMCCMCGFNASEGGRGVHGLFIRITMNRTVFEQLCLVSLDSGTRAGTSGAGKVATSRTMIGRDAKSGRNASIQKILAFRLRPITQHLDLP